MIDQSRLPALSAESIVLATTWQVLRDASGEYWCREFMIGAMRKKLGALPEALDRRRLPADEIERDRARALLTGFCDVCPFKNCPMKHWPDKA